MGLLFLTQSGVQDLDLSSDGFTDTFEMNFAGNKGKDFQFVRSPVANVGFPIISFQISNDGVNWANWEVEDHTFDKLTEMFIFCETKRTNFRLIWSSNGSTGTFTANFNVE